MNVYILISVSLLVAYISVIALDLCYVCRDERVYNKKHKLVIVEYDDYAVAACKKCGKLWNVSKDEAVLLMMLKGGKDG